MGRLVVAVVASLAVMGCVGGNIFGANPGEGGCGFRPDGLIVDDITGIYEGDAHKFTLKLDGIITGTALLYEPEPSASSARASAPASKRAVPRTSASTSSSAPAGPRTLPRNPKRVDATGHWALRPETYLGDIDITDVTSAQGDATFALDALYVSGSRRQPFLYTFGEGDPDSCHIVKYERTARG
jgi:hypothetical protein